MQKIVINSRHGGFGLSSTGIREYLKLDNKVPYFYVQTEYNFREGKEKYVQVSNSEDLFYTFLKDLGPSVDNFGNSWNECYFSDDRISRDDPKLVKVVEELGPKASGRFADLKVVEIPDDVEWVISEYDGMETVEEKHRSWQ